MGPCEANQIEWTRERARTPGHRIVETPFALWTHPSRPAGVLVVTRCRFDAEEYPAQVDQVLRSYQEADSPANWLLGPDSTPPDLKKTLRQQLRFMGPIYLPAMELDLSQDVGVEPGHPCAPIQDWDSALAQGHPAVQWNPKAAQADAGLMMRQIHALGNTVYLGCTVDGEFASAATVFFHDDVAGIYDVVTKPEFRGRGAATSVMLAAIDLARQRGCRVAILQSHKRAAGLYDRLGFQTTGMFASMYYSRPRMEADRGKS